MKRLNFIRYIKCHMKWLFALLLIGFMMTVVMLLNRIPSKEILYGMLVCLFLWFVIAGVDYYYYRRRYMALAQMKASVSVGLEKLPESRNPIEQQYQELLQQLYEANRHMENERVNRERELNEYYTMWVHQIKTPIAALKLLLEEQVYCKAEKADDIVNGENREHEETEELVEACRQEQLQEQQQELFRIEQYAGMALWYTRLGSDTTDYVFHRVALDEVIRECVRKYARMFIRKKVRLNYEEVNAFVVTDEKWLGFVLEQILSNAIKYTPKGSVSIYMEDEKLVIADTGIGIRAEDLPRVCEQGYTGYNGHANQHSTGIGLYLCSRILKKMGHEFEITSEEGVGTKVFISFPKE